ncbi:MAG: hypothetical protein MUC63_07325, partial [Planctomycetes bacterium]|nr:hypothetical protein [Planctomycetota bacterium]
MTRSLRFAALALALAALPTGAPGCAWFLIGAIGAGAYTAGSGGDVEDNRAPYAQVTAPARETATTVSVGFRLTDPDGDPCGVVVAYSTDGTIYLPATAGAGGSGTSGLSSGAGGTDHTFTWDWTADLGAGLHQGVTVSITPTDEKGLAGAPGLSAAFVLGNSAPSAAVSPVPDAVKGIILIGFTLTDATSDLADASVRWSTDGSVYHDCDIVLGALTDVSTSPAGSQHTIAWDSLADGVAQDGTETSVTIRVTPTDEYGLAGAAATTAPFRIGNVKPRAQIVYRNWGYHATPGAEVEFLLVDAESDPCTVEVEYSDDAGRTWGTATLLGQTNPTGPLTSSPAGQTHTIRWNFAADGIDVSGPPNHEVCLRLTPADAHNALGVRGRIRLALGYGFMSGEEGVAFRYSWPYTSEKAPSAAFDAGGQMHVVWYSTLGSPSALQHRVRGPDEQFSPAAAVPTPGSAATNPRIAGTGTSRMHLVWEEATATATEVYYKFYENGAWDAASVLLSNADVNGSSAPVVASDASGFAHVVWVEAGTPARLFYVTNASGSWSAPLDVTPAGETASVQAPDLAVDASGGLHVAYANGTDVRVFSKTGTGWETTSADVSGSDAGPPSAPALAVDPSGVRTVLYVDGSDL